MPGLKHSLHFFFKFLKVIFRSLNVCEDFPGGPVLKNLPANPGDMGSICRGHGFDLWSRKNPCTVGQLRLGTTAAEACTPRSSAPQQEKPHRAAREQPSHGAHSPK